MQREAATRRGEPMTEPTPIAGFERARLWAVRLLRQVANDLEAAEPRQALEALEHLAGALHQVDRGAQLAVFRKS